MNAELAVQYILVNDTAFKGSVSTRVYWDEIEQGAIVPLAVVTCDGVSPNDTHTGVSTLDFDTITVLMYAETEKQVKQMATDAWTALDRVSGTFNGVIVESISFNNQSTDSEFVVDKNVFSVTQSYQVMTQQ